MASFTTLELSGNRVLVEGVDVRNVAHQQIIDATQWKSLSADSKHDDAHAAFDAAVEDFFAPLSAAIDELKKDHKPKLDPIEYVVVQEHVHSTEGQDEIIVQLSYDSLILRLIENDPATERLVWINEQLEVLPEPVKTPPLSWYTGDEEESAGAEAPVPEEPTEEDVDNDIR